MIKPFYSNMLGLFLQLVHDVSQKPLLIVFDFYFRLDLSFKL